MANLLKTGIQFLADKLKAHASETVIYKRGADTVTICATFGKTNYQIEDDSGFQIGGQITDFLFDAEDLIIDGLLTVPKAGDQIQTDSAIYEALFLQDGCWRYSDPYRKIIRLHTKEI
ncbi:MAG: hypothetical protein A2Y10_02475 [Planctomycetes bacterium GWF2_41_51]|nr:MAG: hypothetical protein A2Y10_02475 [Planctomycetes bacterium GWF2_41_51]HBG25671.1 hypothetical protein [Phycisphaerales bacterium]